MLTKANCIKTQFNRNVSYNQDIMKIKELKIYSSRFDKQIAFYSGKIGLKLIEKTEYEAIFQIGKSKLIFKKSERFQPYHFAINIPANREKEALNWLKQRVEILRDGNYEIQNFDSWNARAIYFYDEDKNIVEFIARKNLKNENQGKFDSDSLLEISEIGVSVNDIKPIYNSLAKIVNIQKYDGGLERFCALGDENGLFICINKNIKDWFPTGDKAYSSEFEIDFQENGKDYKLEFKNEQIKAVANTV